MVYLTFFFNEGCQNFWRALYNPQLFTTLWVEMCTALKKKGIMYDYGLKCRVEILLFHQTSQARRFMAKKEEIRCRNRVVDAWLGASVKIGEHFKLSEIDLRFVACYYWLHVV